MTLSFESLEGRKLTATCNIDYETIYVGEHAGVPTEAGFDYFSYDEQKFYRYDGEFHELKVPDGVGRVDDIRLHYSIGTWENRTGIGFMTEVDGERKYAGSEPDSLDMRPFESNGIDNPEGFMRMHFNVPDESLDGVWSDFNAIYEYEVHNLAGDYNGNWEIDFSDFLTFAEGYREKDAAVSDLNFDGEVSFSDFLMFSAMFGQDPTVHLMRNLRHCIA